MAKPLTFRYPDIPVWFQKVFVGIRRVTVGARWRRSSIPAGAILLFVFLILGISGACVFYYRTQEARIIKEKQSELTAVADLKVRQIVRWRVEREGDAMILADNVALARQAEDFFKNRSRKSELLRWIGLMCMHNGYSGAWLFDTSISARLTYGNVGGVVTNEDRDLVREALFQKNIILSDFHLQEEKGEPVADLLVPLVLWGLPDLRVVGAYLFRIDPQSVIFPLLQTWPSVSRSSETLLLRRDKNDVLFLNDVRYRKKSALRLRIPLSSDQAPSVQAVRGVEGPVVGVDYRGVPVLASTKKVPDTPWYLVAKIDRDEIDDVLREQAWFDGAVGVLLILATTALIGFWWRHQRVQFFRSQFQAEQERRALMQHFEYLVRFANDIIVLADKELKILEINDRGVEAYGYSREELVGSNVVDLESKEAAVRFPERIKMLNVYRGGRYESEHKRRDGTKFPVEISARVIEIEGSIFYQTIARDITERRKAEREIKEREFWIQESQRIGRIGSYALDLQNNRWTSSEVLDGIFGLESDFDRNIEGWVNIVHPEQREEMLRYFANEVIAAAQPFDKEYKIIRVNDGAERWVWGRGELTFDGHGSVLTMVGTIQDITERKQADEEIKRLNAELEQRVRDRTSQLEHANRELEAFSYSVSHDLRAPLRGIDGWSLALSEDYRSSLDERAFEFIARIRAEAQRMGILIDDLLQLSRVTRAEIVVARVNLSERARIIASRLRELYPHRSIEFTIEERLSADGDGHLLEIALTNLLDNACKFSSSRTSAVIEFGRTNADGGGAFFVRDNGVGFDMEYAKKLFGAFQRMHKSSEFPGTGIGLATVQRIIHRHGGRVWADASVDRGATFYFTIGVTV